MEFIFSIGDVAHRENRQTGRQVRGQVRGQVRAAASPDSAADCIARRSARSRAFTMQHARSAWIPVAGKYTAIGRAERVRKARKRRAQRDRENCRCGTTLPRQIIASRSLSTAGSCATDLSRRIPLLSQIIPELFVTEFQITRCERWVINNQN